MISSIVGHENAQLFLAMVIKNSTQMQLIDHNSYLHEPVSLTCLIKYNLAQRILVIMDQKTKHLII